MATEEKVRNVWRYIKADAVEVGDVPGHIIGIAESGALAFLDMGEVGTYSTKVMFDYVNGSGPHQGAKPRHCISEKLTTVSISAFQYLAKSSNSVLFNLRFSGRHLSF